VPALISVTGLHANTVREHLDGLRRSGLVTRDRAPAMGRGRPGWLYTATYRSQDDPRPEYAGLAVALAAVIVRTSSDPAAEARRAGADWGRRLTHELGSRPTGTGADAAREATTRVFDQMGFAPEPSADGVELRLTRCPLLEAARQQPEVVCSVHHGIAQGIFEEHGAGTDGIELLPFIEPGACLLRLGPSPDH